MVKRGLAATRADARDLIGSGRVLVAGSVAHTANRQVSPAEALVIAAPPARFVGRGGEKLEAALGRFDLRVAGLRAIDVGASTGGFTDCLLQRGAFEVVALDVGYGQLHERLRADRRVTSLERTNVRGVDVASLGGPAPVVVVDVSFISLRAVAPWLLALLTPGGDLVALVKPQFEAERAESSRGNGVIHEPAVWRRVLGEVSATLAGLGAAMMGAMVSPLTGASGNVEFLVHWRAPTSAQRVGVPGSAPVSVEPQLDGVATGDKMVEALLDAVVVEAQSFARERA